jgi:hypothetical protein
MSIEDDFMEDSFDATEDLEKADPTDLEKADNARVDLTADDDAQTYSDTDAIDFGEDDVGSAIAETVSEIAETATLDAQNDTLDESNLTANQNQTEGNQKSLLGSFTPPKRVADFLWAVLTRIAPREMLGGRKSRASIRGFISRLVALRRFEKCTLHEATRGVPLKEFPWLFGVPGEYGEKKSARNRNYKQTSTEGIHKEKNTGKRNSQEKSTQDTLVKGTEGGTLQRNSKEKGTLLTPQNHKKTTRGGPNTADIMRAVLLRRWLLFVVAKICVPVLRAHFYVTETETHRLRVFYYRKGVWARLTAAHLQTMTEDHTHETRRATVPPLVLRPSGARTNTANGDDADFEHDPRAQSRAGYAFIDPSAAASTATASYRRLPKRKARLLLQRHLLGFSRLRLLPKATGVRPVAMLGRYGLGPFQNPGTLFGPITPDCLLIYTLQNTDTFFYFSIDRRLRVFSRETPPPAKRKRQRYGRTGLSQIPPPCSPPRS